MKYALLKTTHPTYDPALLQQLSDLYTGGYQLLGNASRYLTKVTDESDVRFADRVRCASYLPYFGQIVDQLTAWLFSQELTVVAAADASDPDTIGDLPDKAYYAQLSRDADRQGNAFTDVMRAAICSALVKKTALVGVDFPAVTGAAQSLADEDALGAAAAYVYPIPLESRIDWEYDDSGRLAFVVLNTTEQRRASVSASRGVISEYFKVWEMTEAGTARWTKYRIDYSPNKPPDADADVAEVGAGDTSFRQIPVLDMTLTDGLWVGNKIGPSALELFQRRSTLINAEYRSLVATPYVKLGSEIGAPGGTLPSESQQNPNRAKNPATALTGKGYLVLGADDDVGFAEPSGGCYKLVDDQLKDLKDEIFRVVHLMAASVSNSSSSMGRSGLSKSKDMESTAIVLTAMGSAVRRFAARIYTCISQARSEDVVWTPRGLDSFDMDDRALLLQEAVQVDAVAIPSPTFKKSYKTRLAFKLEPNLPPPTQDVIRAEIESGVEGEEEMRTIMASRLADPSFEDGDEQAAPGDAMTTDDSPKRKRAPKESA